MAFDNVVALYKVTGMGKERTVPKADEAWDPDSMGFRNQHGANFKRSNSTTDQIILGILLRQKSHKHSRKRIGREGRLEPSFHATTRQPVLLTGPACAITVGRIEYQ